MNIIYFGVALSLALLVVSLIISVGSLNKWRMSSQAEKDAHEQREFANGLVKTEGMIIAGLIEKYGIDEALFLLQECGYQISEDDTEAGRKYTLYDVRGRSVELSLHEEGHP